MVQQRITEIVLIPDGMPWDNINVSAFQTTVRYRGMKDGKDRWMVENGASQLSRAGNWKFYPPKFKWDQYRWETMDEALMWARKVANDVKVNGRTWAEWQAYHAGGDSHG